jgi:hypothetical protein
MLTLIALRALADAIGPETPTWKAARGGAVIRHGVVWAAFGCNPLTLPLHIAAVAYVYGGEHQ